MERFERSTLALLIVLTGTVFISAGGPVSVPPTSLDDLPLKERRGAQRLDSPGRFARSASPPKGERNTARAVRLKAFGGDDLYGLKDQHGNVIVPPRFKNEVLFFYGDKPLERIYDTGIAAAKIGERWGFINESGEFCIAPTFEEVGFFSDGFGAVKRGKKWGYIDRTGKTVIEPQFQYADNFNYGIAPAFDGNRWGFIDKAGDWFIPPIYDYARPFHEERAAVYLGGKWGFIDRSGTLVIPPRYESVSAFRDGAASVSDGYGSGSIDRDGKVLKPLKPRDF